jgi:hypothetical protein
MISKRENVTCIPVSPRIELLDTPRSFSQAQIIGTLSGPVRTCLQLFFSIVSFHFCSPRIIFHSKNRIIRSKIAAGGKRNNFVKIVFGPKCVFSSLDWIFTYPNAFYYFFQVLISEATSRSFQLSDPKWASAQARLPPLIQR